MELYFLGTNAGLPTTQRNVTSVALRMLEERRCSWLFDCGEATQHQILHSPLKLNRLEKIFITHMHGDHVFGLPGLLSSRASQEGTSPLTVYGPQGLKAFLEVTLSATQSRIEFGLEIVEHSGGLIFEDKQIKVEAAALEHRIESYGYRITEKDRPGSLNMELLQEWGVRPGPEYGKLKGGESITANGRTITSGEVLGPPKRGRIVTILGDTRPTSGIHPLAEGADMLVHESTFTREFADLAQKYYHSTAEQAANAAKKAGVGELILTHFSSRYKDYEQLQPLLEEARAIFPNTQLAVEHQSYPIRSAQDREKE
ncbi:ribonuclease Z [Saccharibacillus kuerlensis]|uniref:Ribonuclease Z n=1 Tax=Saccharibacillus kuerlensis TaxID=459527 RepID=A0ABQ2L961_9BACL|nr:ribonuclease Z [Saccharibacillus kuerlensis]GGO07314.1 ribonuclease Z [Saccharibacillus kuerlensis]